MVFVSFFTYKLYSVEKKIQLENMTDFLPLKYFRFNKI